MASDVIDVTLVLDTNAYADNDVLAIPLAVPGFFRGPGDVRKLVSVVLLDEADQAQDIDLIFLDGDVTLGTINAAVNISDADARKILGTVSILIADYCDTINSQVATKRDLNLMLKASSPGTTLWIAAVLRSGTPTYAASSLRLKLGVTD